jgi:hypothetical protein
VAAIAGAGHSPAMPLMIASPIDSVQKPASA